MKKVKACLNSECSECKKTYYKATDEFCVKCGSRLSYVCKHKNCFKALPDDSKDVLCPVHLAEKKDREEKVKDGLMKVGTGIVAAAGFVISVVGAINNNNKES